MSEEEFSFANLLPTGEKLMLWLTYSTTLGLLVFPFLALTIEQKFAIHFWVLTILDACLLFALLYLRGQMAQIEHEKQQFVEKPKKQKKSAANENDKVAQKAKKESQKQNQKNFQKVGKQKQFTQQRK